MSEDYKYAGFISYAHADEAVAARLHKALETYKTPKGLSVETIDRLSPIFRDTTELTAHHSLSEKIHDAVNSSRFLIVLCSPAAKASHWVNEEIRLFRTIHGEASILCVLAEGTPETAFPLALLEGGREPLAANIGQSREGFRLGTTQLAASMLGVGLDSLIQRNTQRRRRRLQGVTAAALVFSGIMGATAYTAVDARNAAENNRMRAEGLVEYMITDLKQELEPVGRLDILDGIGAKAVEYYETQDIKALPDDSLARQARSRHILGQVALDAGDFDKARSEIEAAAKLTKEIYDRNPDDTDGIFAHAQSEYWVGAVYDRMKKNEKSLLHMKAYAELTEVLFQSNPNSFDWVMERGWGTNNVGNVHRKLNDMVRAKKFYHKAIKYFELALKLQPENYDAQTELANVLEGLAQISYIEGEKAQAFEYRQRQNAIFQLQYDKHPENYLTRYRRVQALSRLITDGFLENDPKKEQSTIEYVHDEYNSLLDYSPENKRWKKNYRAYLIALTSESHLDRLDQDDLRNRLEKLDAM